LRHVLSRPVETYPENSLILPRSLPASLLYCISVTLFFSQLQRLHLCFFYPKNLPRFLAKTTVSTWKTKHQALNQKVKESDRYFLGYVQNVEFAEIAEIATSSEDRTPYISEEVFSSLPY